MAVEMRIQGLMIDPITTMPLLVLRDPRTDAKLPIWVAVFEANAIATELEKVKTPRPMTHDLLQSLLRELGGRLRKVTVTDLQDNIFYAVLEVECGGEIREIDARPSDAIALALRCGAPIYARQEVIEAAQNIDLTQGHRDSKRIREWLQGLGQSELGKYEI
ncbi:MAG: bifunctional nuclease family protein [Acidobacteriota bacterium]|nr:bifunctional nuclease family protein [Acidobacteriota bacterium]MDQ7086780.1 bifunctional nuclease family protein [Acidobacteriota bacterium]